MSHDPEKARSFYNKGRLDERIYAVLVMRESASRMEKNHHERTGETKAYMAGAMYALRDLADRLEMGNEATDALMEAARAIEDDNGPAHS